MNNAIAIAKACRTPVGSFGGLFLGVIAVSLGSVVIAEAIKRAGIQSSVV